ncbi:MAG TPA: LptE family protein [Catalimonadaceae bacterium]|nr:LptE family protein [Catalimonadaceae bacterium]
MALKNRACFWIFIFATLIFSQSCGVYSFTGASIAPDVKTISVLNFGDKSANSPPYLAQTFAEKAREYYQRNTSLTLANRDGDLNLEGTIMQYGLSPVAPTGAPGGTGVERAAQTRLTISVRVKFTNVKNKLQNFDQNFSFYADFDQSKSLSAVERELIEQISDQIILDIFNKTVANW